MASFEKDSLANVKASSHDQMISEPTRSAGCENNATDSRPAKTTVAIHNPYARSKKVESKPSESKQQKQDCIDLPNPGETKFVSGAVRARKMAAARLKRRPGKPVSAPTNPEDSVLSHHMNPFDRFFACLLYPSPAEYYIAATDEARADQLLAAHCARVGVPAPTGPLLPSYMDVDAHLMARTSLILEEARHAVTESLHTTWNRRMVSMHLVLHSVDRYQGDFGSKLCFRSNRRFSREQLLCIRPGTVVQCRKRDESTIAKTVLGVIVTGNRETVEKDNMFQVLCFRSTYFESLDDCALTVLAPLVSECRAFDALTKSTSNSELYPAIIGGKQAKLTKFDGNGDEIAKEADNNHRFTAKDGAVDNPYFSLNSLNPTQESSAAAFLHSRFGSVTLIQGPPGTGKTTLLVAIICRLLLTAKEGKNDSYRLLVAAPTNKAISLLASRFLKSTKREAFNAVLVGDADKLLSDEGTTGAHSGGLRSIFLYSWVQFVVDTYIHIKMVFLSGHLTQGKIQELQRIAHKIMDRVQRQLDHVAEPFISLMENICTTIDSLEFGGSPRGIEKDIDELVKVLKALPTESVYPQVRRDCIFLHFGSNETLLQLLNSANVIFSTLVAAGGSVFKKTEPVDDLIVDEAAAATEPELYIPLHMGPSRLLAVGDPLQLPATVLSKRACQLGLSKSLHERLMFDCDFPHFVLDLQYRMSCQISSFPSRYFYEDRIGNARNVGEARYTRGPVLLDKLPYMFCNVEGTEEKLSSGSLCNRREAERVVDLVLHLVRMDSSWCDSNRLRIITFYQAQVLLIKRLLGGWGSKVVVATVDSSQGCEADIVLVSFVRNPANASSGSSAGFLTDDRRMNVALTRARFQLVCVANVKEFHLFRGAETLHKLAQDARQRGLIRTPVDDITNERANQPMKRFKKR